MLNLANVKSNNLVLHGVGEAFLLSADGSIAGRLSKLQSMSIEVSSESEDVYGGDSLFPIFNYIKSKTATFKFKNATMNMDVLAVTQGTVVEGNGEVNAVETLVVKGNKANLSATTGVDLESVVVIADGKALKRATSPTTSDQFSVTETGVLTFATGFTNTTIEVSYVYKVTDGSTVNVLTNDVPGFVELRHTSAPVKLPDGRKVQLHTRVYKAVCDGGFNLEYTRDGAVAPEVTFKSVDPERPDKRFVTYSLTEVK